MNIGGQQSGMHRAGGPMVADAIMPSQLSLRRQNKWLFWGGRDFEPSSGTLNGSVAAANDTAQMAAIPAYFPEKGTITKLATIFEPSAAQTCGWIGLARDVTSSGEHYPGSTISGSAADLTHGVLGVRKIIGANISVPIAAEEIVWLVFQNNMAVADGSVFVGVNRADWPVWGGIVLLEGLDLNGTVGGGNPSIAQFNMLYIPTGSAPAYSLGRNFPAGASLLSPSDITAMWGSATMPAFIFQWRRG